MIVKLNEQKSWWKAYLNKKVILKNLKETVNNNHITFSKNCYQIEKKLKKILGVKHVILTNSGTSALFMATMVAVISHKGRVFCPIMTWPGTINGALHAKKNVTYIDNVKNSLNANYFYLLNKIKQKDILFITHLNGKSAYDSKTFKMIKKTKAFVIEDAAQSFLAKDYKNKFLGTQFDIGCFSLGYTKMCNMIYGGFCVTNSDKLANLLKIVRNNGVAKSGQIATNIGGNFKPNDVNACIGLDSLANAFRNKKKLIENYNLYAKNLKNKKLNLIRYKNLNNEFPTYIDVVTNNRNNFFKYLKKNNIGYSYSTRSLAKSPHLQILKKFKYANEMDNKLVRLPSGPGYHKKDLLKIIKKLNKY